MSGRAVWVSVSAITVTAAAVAVTAFLFFFKSPAPPDIATQTPGQVAQYLASPEFEKLNATTKNTYFGDVVRRYEDPESFRRLLPSLDLSPEHMERLGRNVGPLFQKLMDQRIEKYFNLPPSDRTAYLDSLIDQGEAMMKAVQEQRRARRSQTTAPAGAAPSGPRPEQPGPDKAAAPAEKPGDRPSPRGFTPQRMKEMIENSTPEERARRTEFVKIVINRVVERGFRLPFFSGRPSQRPSGR